MKILRRPLHPTAPLHSEGPWILEAGAGVVPYIGICVSVRNI